MMDINEEGKKLNIIADRFNELKEKWSSVVMSAQLLKKFEAYLNSVEEEVGGRGTLKYEAVEKGGFSISIFLENPTELITIFGNEHNLRIQKYIDELNCFLRAVSRIVVEEVTVGVLPKK